MNGGGTCISSVMNYNNIPPVQNVIQQSKYVEYPCLTGMSSDSNVPLEFRMEKTGMLTDLNQIYLSFSVKVEKSDGSAILETDSVAPVNNFGYAIFSGIDVHIQDQKISNNDGYYPYLSYLNLLLHTTGQEKEYYMREALWRKDTAGMMDKVGVDEAGVCNQGFVDRAAYIQKSAEVDLFVKVLFDFGITQLLPETEIFLRFHRNEPSKCLIAKEGDYRIAITKARILALQVTPTPHGRGAIPKLIHIPATRYYTVSRMATKNDQNCDWVPYAGRLPRRLYFFQTLCGAYNGDISKNIFNFGMFNMKKIQLYKNGESIPLAQGFDIKDGGEALLYNLSLNSFNRPEAIYYNSFEFKHGYFVVIFDLTNDLSAGLSNYNNPQETGTLRLTIDYQKPLEKSITLFCVLEMPAVLGVDDNRNCTWLN